MAVLDVSHGGNIPLQSGVVIDSIVGLQNFGLPTTAKLIGPPLGQSPAIIRVGSSQGYAFKIVAALNTLSNIRFDLGGVYFEGDGCNQAVVDNCEFAASVKTGPLRCGLQFGGNISKVRVTNNLFAGTNGSFNLYSDSGGDDVVITNNEFINTRTAIHWTGTLNRFLVEQNYCHGITAQALEFQGGGSGNIFQDNWVEAHVLSSDPNQNGSAYSFSLPLQDTLNTIIRRNVSIQPTSANSPDKIGVRIIFEVGGKNLVCEDNYSDGGNHVIAGNGAGGNGVGRNNRISNYREAPSNANGNTTVYSNNGPNVANSIDLVKRGRPYRNKRYGSTPIPPIPPTPAPAKIVDVTVRFDDGTIVVTKP